MHHNLKLAILGALRRQKVLEINLDEALPKRENEYNQRVAAALLWNR